MNTTGTTTEKPPPASSHLDAFALALGADGSLSSGGSGSRGGHGRALGARGARGEREGEGGEEGRSLAQEAVDGLVLLHGPLPVGLACRGGNTDPPAPLVPPLRTISSTCSYFILMVGSFRMTPFLFTELDLKVWIYER